MIILALAPIATWLFLFVGLRHSEQGWRASLLAASILWGVLLVLFTEGLSLLHAIAPMPILGVWTAAAAVSLYLFRDQLAGKEQGLRSLLPAARRSWRALTLFPRLLLGGIVLSLSLTLLIGIVAPPNNWDSMVYHMTRVMHWLQNGSVAHYPTHSPLQLYFPPWAEYAILHFQALSGTDRLANMVQWFALVGSVIGASVAARQLGAGARGQVLAAFAAATLPMGIMQATNTKNDLVLAFWSVAAVSQGLLLQDDRSWRRVLLFGAGLGLAVLTKGTAFFFVFPFALWLCILLYRSEPRLFPARIALICCIAFLLNAGHWWRNYTVFGHPLASAELAYVRNEDHGPPAILSNLLRNYSLHFNTGSQDINRTVIAAVTALHDEIGRDVNDPRTTLYGPYQFPAFFGHVLHEDVAGNLVHALFLIPAALLPAFARRLRPGPRYVPYLAALVAAAVLFCMILKWQPWNSRLHLPLFILLAPLAGCLLDRLSGRLATPVLSALLLAYALPYLTLNISRPLVTQELSGPMAIPSILTGSRFGAYFNNLPQVQPETIRIVDGIHERNCTAVGMLSGGSVGGEYLLWAALREANMQVRIEDVQVENRTGRIPWPAFTPCVTVKF